VGRVEVYMYLSPTQGKHCIPSRDTVSSLGQYVPFSWAQFAVVTDVVSWQDSDIIIQCPFNGLYCQCLYNIFTLYKYFS